MAKKKKNLLASSSPARIISISFLLVILSGTFLLTLPAAAKNGMATPFIDALFTATSATCVTGLIMYDTFSHWTVFGQTVIICLIQIGGLGLVTFASFFNIIAGNKMGIRTMQIAKESVNTESVADLYQMVRIVISYSMFFELIGAFLLAFAFVPKFGTYGIFMSVFIAISAFCNAGFDLFGIIEPYSSLTTFTGNYWVTLVIAFLIIFGGLGFIVWNNIVQFKRTRKLYLQTKIVVTATAVLIILGTVGFLLLEWSNPQTLGHLSSGEKVLAAFFQSVTCRTAGFNSIDLTPLSGASKTLAILLMFIGVAPGSTGGGVKLTTIVVLFMTVVSMARGHSDAIIARRKISPLTVYKSMTILICGTLLVCFSAAVLLATTPLAENGLTTIDAFLEAVSAFSTTGISTGVTSLVTFPGKIMLCLTMFFGRIGPVSFMLAVAHQTPLGRKEIIPDAKIMVG